LDETIQAKRMTRGVGNHPTNGSLPPTHTRHPHTHIHTHTHTHTYTHTHTHTPHVFIQTHTRTHTYLHMHPPHSHNTHTGTNTSRNSAIHNLPVQTSTRVHLTVGVETIEYGCVLVDVETVQHGGPHVHCCWCDSFQKVHVFRRMEGQQFRLRGHVWPIDFHLLV
jgi:hypothetical protein